MRTTLLIDNREVPASSGETFQRLSPIDGSLVTEAAAATLDDARLAIESAAAAFPAWAALGPNARRDILMESARLLQERVNELIEPMMQETGAAQPWIRFNVKIASGMLREAAALTTQIKGEVIPTDKPGAMTITVRRPVGVILSIVPWNAPIILAVRSFALALACGNTVVMKAASPSPGTQFNLVRIMRDAGLPPGVLNYISNAPANTPKIVESMIAHPAVRRVNITGSTGSGRAVAEICGRHLKPVLLELGGKAPMIVLEDADIEHAARACAFGAYIHQGQVCMSTERAVVENKIADAFAEKLAAKAKTIATGDPRKSDAPLGSLIGKADAARVKDLIEDAVAKGARLLAGGTADGALMTASVLDHVTPEMKIYYEESFGPVVCLVRVDGVEEAVRVANDTEYGLSSSIFTHDVKKALEVASRLDFGCCHINGPTVHDEPQMPLGGMKASGYGRFGGQPGISEFTELQCITIEDPSQHYPF
ncbi:aldehyde dehydrogenase [Rhodoplanes roseus]|uniref:Salicylaldehyde dehydrogenase n=1 Tax=Rhodoplanes roseus TaxID=29409 RepID=A0A327L1J5_9BRAD|nr:aldehyde dehydrogenase [Rhodoplanes roseus]RAI44366.1 salicylaldehyde dehydrogenase [Rhodoplanes roseus]